MPYTTDVFTNWRAFESWSALKTWLQSAEGGKLRIVEPKDSVYALVRYVKGQSDFSKPHVAWCRSVVVDTATRLPVCVAPPKASKFAEDVAAAVQAEEFVDGTMINIYQTKGGEPSLATRSRIGGKGRFYDGGLTFEEMMDSLVVDRSKILKANENATSVFTSVVLQHPSNRIVKAVEKAGIQIVHQGSVASDGVVSIEEDAGEFHSELDADTEIQPYNLEAIRGAKSVEAWVSQQAQERGFGWQGLVLKDGKGGRFRVRSQVYETVRRIRGNESSKEERFARLRKTRGMTQYLAFYPEDREAMYELEGLLRKNTRQLYTFYGDVFRGRKTPYHELPWPYKHHVSVLHNLFKDVLRAQSKKVTLEEVVKYVNGLGLEDLVNMTKVHNLELRKKPEGEVTTAAETEATVAAEQTTEAE